MEEDRYLNKAGVYLGSRRDGRRSLLVGIYNVYYTWPVIIVEYYYALNFVKEIKGRKERRKKNTCLICVLSSSLLIQ